MMDACLKKALQNSRRSICDRLHLVEIFNYYYVFCERKWNENDALTETMVQLQKAIVHNTH